MGFSASSSSSSSSAFKQKPFAFSLIVILSLSILFLTLSFRPKPETDDQPVRRTSEKIIAKPPSWFHVVSKEFGGKKIKMALVNMDEDREEYYNQLPNTETVSVKFDRVSDDLKWHHLFPEWIDESAKWSPPRCPEIPMPKRLDTFRDLDVVVARNPCGGFAGVEVEGEGEGVRDVHRLQVNLVVANLTVRSGWVTPDVDLAVYVVFEGSCGPMRELFRCDDMVMKEGDHWVYKPDLRRLKQKVLMPVGSCQIAPPFAERGKELWRRHWMSQSTLKKLNYTTLNPREAYVTVLHSSESYVCGAIALAQSIKLTNSTKDLVLLADDSITPKSIKGLKAAGWKVRRIQRIRSPHAKKHAYNEWNYSKLRIWQLKRYDKVIFIDADFLVLKNIDEFFYYPQLSAAGNDKVLFNSGIMVIEPSMCTFEELMLESFKLRSYNGGDQGFLNEFFTWWHRLPSKLNRMKVFPGEEGNERHVLPNGDYAVHYLGLKPWMCYRDYDCNWDVHYRQIFASDTAHRRWWKVYDTMPKGLQKYCGLTKNMDTRIKKWRGVAKKANLSDGHWKIKVRDPRQHRFVE